MKKKTNVNYIVAKIIVRLYGMFRINDELRYMRKREES